MPALSKTGTKSSLFKDALSAAKKLSAEEKQLLRLRLFSDADLQEMKNFEAGLKKKKAPVK